MIGARDRHLAGLDRLAQAIQHLGLELRQFVEKQDAIVRERNLPRLGVHAAADQRRHRGGMVRASERATVSQGAACESAGNRMDHRHFEEFAWGQGRQDRRQALGQHRLARPGRAAHQEVMASGRGNFERALGALLALDVAQIRLGSS